MLTEQQRLEVENAEKSRDALVESVNELVLSQSTLRDQIKAKREEIKQIKAYIKTLTADQVKAERKAVSAEKQASKAAEREIIRHDKAVQKEKARHDKALGISNEE